MFMKKYLLFFLSLIFVLCSENTAFATANVRDLIENYTDNFLSHKEYGGVNLSLNGENDNTINNIYEAPTNQSLALLFWAVNLYKLEDDNAVDEFSAINECQIFQKFNADELEWTKIREATRKYLSVNKEHFPSRFEFPIPLMLEGYDERKGIFNLAEGFEITSGRRFELFSLNYSDLSCRHGLKKSLSYPRAIVLEFSRPFTLTGIPMSRVDADDYIKRKNTLAQKTLWNRKDVSKEYMMGFRKAVLFLRTKIFTHGRILGVNNYHIQSVQMLGILEGYDIYEDMTKEKLIYSQTYTTNRDKSVLYTGLQEQYDILKEKAAGEGILH